MEHINGDYGCMGDLGMHVLHVPLRLGWKPQTVHAQLVKQVRERPTARAAWRPARPGTMRRSARASRRMPRTSRCC